MVTMRRYSVANSAIPTIRVVVLGGKKVGKSALVVRFLTKRFIGEYVSGTEITYQQEVNLSGNKVTAEICDALIDQELQSYLKKLSANTEAYILVYNVCTRDSFDYACQLAHDIKASHLHSSGGKNDVPLLLIGNKSDLHHFREVDRREGEEFAKSLSLCHFTETSAAESYSEVEKAFHIAFGLVRNQMQTSPTHGATSGRLNRKHSLSQMAHLIRDQYRKHSMLHHYNRANSLERGMSLAKINSLFSDNKHNSSTPDLSFKRKPRKNVVATFHHDPLKSSCTSLCPLSECPIREEINKLDSLNLGGSLSLSEHCHALHDKETKYTTGPTWKENNSQNCDSLVSDMKTSLSSDETADLSDISTPDEDAFLPESNFPKSNCRLDSTSSSDERGGYNGLSALPVRKSLINKKNLKISVHSDGEFEGKEIKELPPKSAPILHSTSKNKFRYYPNGIPDSQQDSRIPLLSPPSSSNVPISPLLDNAPRPQRIKTSKEDKRSPTYNSFLKQFFKGNRNGLSSINRHFGSSQSLNSQVSSASSETSLSSYAENSRNNARGSDDGKLQEEKGKKVFHASSISLSSVLSREVGDCNDFNYVTYSAPSSPKIGKNGSRLKNRRPSFREAVGGLVRKRKQSVTNDCLKHSKERFL